MNSESDSKFMSKTDCIFKKKLEVPSVEGFFAPWNLFKCNLVPYYLIHLLLLLEHFVNYKKKKKNQFVTVTIHSGTFWSTRKNKFFGETDKNVFKIIKKSRYPGFMWTLLVSTYLGSFKVIRNGLTYIIVLSPVFRPWLSVRSVQFSNSVWRP